MTSVISTKALKIEMLTAGSPMLPSAASSSDTVRPPGAGAGRAVVVVLEALAHLVGDRVGVLVGVRDVEVGDRERGDELGQAEQDAQVHVAEDLGGHEAGRVGREQDVEQ